MQATLSAFFLCAGYGQRLRPLTDRIPKPAILFQGKSALEINVRKAKTLLPTHLLCNTHHLYAEMEKPARRLGLNTLYEKNILGTGGCIYNAKHILESTDQFLVHNGDLIHNIDLKDLLTKHRDSGNIGTLAGILRPKYNTLGCAADGRLLGVHGFNEYAGGGSEITRFTFAGIAVYDKAFLDFFKPGEADIKPSWIDAMRVGHKMGVVNYSYNSSWFDFGTPQGLWEASQFMMEQTKDYSYRYNPPIREARPYVSNEAGVEELPVGLRNVVVIEEPEVELSEDTENKIVGRDFRWEIKV